jgi:stearoyl-CoA 9-desaturase NADPH oxidoreductase
MITTTPARILRHLASPLDADAYLSLLNPLWGSRLRGVVESVTPLSASAAAIRIRTGGDWQGHRPGQFVTIGVDVDGVRHHRCYSLTSPPPEPGRRPANRIEIAVQATDEGVVSNHLVRRTRPGAILQLAQASGDFTIDAGGSHRAPADRAPVDQPLLFITGGSGITPVIGMLRTMRRSPRTAPVTLLHHATDPSRCLFVDELVDMARLHDWLDVTISYTRAGDGGGRGRRLDPQGLDRLCADWRDRETYVCGPDALRDFAVDHWSGSGLADRLHVESFTPRNYVPAPHEGSTTPIARFASSGIDTFAEPGTPLLETAERAGLAPPAGCRMGICHTCTTRLDSGCVRDLRDGRLKGPGEHVQICVSAATEDVVLDL